MAAAACSLASPLAGAFLLLGAVAWASTGRWRSALPLGAAVLGVGLAVVAGGGGTFPLSVVTLIPIALLVGIGLYLAPPSYRALRRGLLLYGGVLWGVLPGQPGISWEGHLFGFAGGAVAARLLTPSTPHPHRKPAVRSPVA